MPSVGDRHGRLLRVRPLRVRGVLVARASGAPPPPIATLVPTLDARVAALFDACIAWDAATRPTGRAVADALAERSSPG